MILGFLLVSMICIGQERINEELNIQQKSNHVYDNLSNRSFYVPNPDTLLLLNITTGTDEINNGWATIGTACAGCPSYHYKIFRTQDQQKAEDGKYFFYYYFYFYSNSYQSDGSPAGTYLSHVHFFIDENIVLDIEYILIDEGKIVYAAWIRSMNPSSTVLFKPTKVTVY